MLGFGTFVAPVGVEDPRFKKPDEKVEEKLSLEDLLRPENVKIMKDTMRDWSGPHIDRLSDEDLRSSFLSRMRDFDTSDRGILDEGLFYAKGTDEQRIKSGKGYMLYDSLGSVFTSGSTLDAVQGVAEHVWNVINPADSPSTYAGFGIAKVGSLIIGKTTGQAIKSTTKKLAKDQIKDIGKLQAQRNIVEKGALREAKKEVIRTAVRGSVEKATKNQAMKQAVVAAGVDMFTGGALDWHYQNIKMKTNAQEEYSRWQTGLSALGGLVGGGVEWFRISRGTKQTTASYNKDWARDWRKKRAQQKVDREVIDKRIVNDIETWAEKILKGEEIYAGWKDLKTYKSLKKAIEAESESDFMLGESLTNQFWESILVGDKKKGVDGLARIMQEEGFLPRLRIEEIDPDTGKLKGFTDKFTNLFINSYENGGLSDVAKEKITKALEKIGLFDEVEKASGRTIQIKNIEDLARLFARDVSQGGKRLNLASRLAKVAKGDSAYLRALQEEQETIEAIKGTTGFADMLNGFKKNAYWMQNVWRRNVVAALSTSVLNLKGFKAASAINLFADTSLILGGAVVRLPTATFKLAKGDVKGFARDFSFSNDIFQNQVERLRNLFDPNSTREMFEDFMRIDKRSAKVLDRAIAGGLDGAKNLEEIAKKFDIEPDWMFRGVEGYTNVSQKLMLVDTVDKFMKSQAYLGNLDMTLRENIPGMNFRRLSQLNYKEMTKILMTEEFANATIEATNRTMSDIFSKSYRYASKDKEENILNIIAGGLERWGNIPVIGTIFPFGKFFNNTVALTYDVFGGGSIQAASELVRTGAVSRGTLRRAAKAPIGGFGFGLMYQDPLGLSTADKDEEEKESNLFEDVIAGAMTYTALNFSWERDREKMRLGLRWNEELQSNGTIKDITYDFPASQYALVARVYNLVKGSSESLPPEITTAMYEQLLYGQVQRNLGKFGSLEIIVGDIYNDIVSGDSTNIDKQKQLAARSAGTLISGQVSGFFRPFDAVNKLAGYYLGSESETKDAKQVNTMLYDSGRYLHNIFEVLNGDTKAPEKKVMTREGKVYPTSPLSDVLSERTIEPKTYTDLALSDVNLQGWKQTLKSYYPEGLSMFNETIAPVLEKRFERLLKSSKYEKMTYDQKSFRIKGILSQTKTDIKDRMVEGLYGTDNRRARYIMIIADTKDRHRKLALEKEGYKLSISNQDLLQLDTLQLGDLVRRIEREKKSERLQKQGRE